MDNKQLSDRKLFVSYEGERIMKNEIGADIIEMPSSQEINESIERLLEHSKNKKKFRKDPFLLSTGGIDCANYKGQSIKRSKFSQKRFNGSIFENSTAAGSNFTYCKFENCKFINANFQECTFKQCNISYNTTDNPIINSNFNRSLFSDGFSMKDVCFHHSILRQTAFVDGVMENMTFYSSTLEDTVFSNVIMKNVRFDDLNIDYSVFSNNYMDNVTLPFSQVCFSFGLLSYMMKSDGKIYITSAKNDTGRISKNEFLSLLPYFEIYYLGTEDFFPLANIYLALERYDDAQKVILNGILSAITNFDFRQIKYLCKLVSIYPVFGFHQRKQIYDYINTHISFCNMDSCLLYNYNTYKNEISSFLLNNNRTEIITSEIDIITQILPNESNKLGILLTTLEDIIDTNKSHFGEHKITCRHNSAEEIIILIQDIYQSLCLIIPAVYSVLLGIYILDEKKDMRATRKLEKRNAAELRQIEIERAKIALAREKMQLEKEQNEFEAYQIEQNHKKNQIKENILRRNILDRDIGIAAINHITYGDIPPEAEKNICQFSFEKDG